MEQMYLIEIFIDTVSIFVPDDDKDSANKNLIIKVRFGPKVQFIVKEGQLAPAAKANDVVECDEQGRKKFSRTIRVGKSYLFPSYPDTVLMMLSKFPLEIEVWNDDDKEVEIYVGIGTMHWETKFFHYLKETADACRLHDPLSLKQVIPLMAECCCKQCGDIAFILRVSSLGDSIITEFQQLMSDPNAFCFRTNKAPSTFQCKRVEGNDPNFCMVGTLYETATLEDPSVLEQANMKIEVCTELQSCGVGQKGVDNKCKHSGGKEEPKKSYAIEKIRMGDIIGPCGNANCPLAHKVRNYIRKLDTYGHDPTKMPREPKSYDNARKICGTCDCVDERWHREKCPDKDDKAAVTVDGKPVCKGCGGIAQVNETCDDKVDRLHNTGVTPKVSPKSSHVNYMIGETRNKDLMESMFGKDYVVQNVATNFNAQSSENKATTSQSLRCSGCCCRRPEVVAANTKISNNVCDVIPPENKSSTRSFGFRDALVYNVAEGSKDPKNNKSDYKFCLEMPADKDCKCSPPKPSPPCRTFDCECIAEIANKTARKTHKPYCPSYKHKNNCPVTMNDDEKKMDEYEEDEAEPLPYGLPPIQLGPCPVLGRPCSVPDGYSRMYKTAVMPLQPPSYSDAGKVCCSKEYERIKKAIKEYMKYEKDNDFRCINKFNVDTETRCCDKEQRLLALMGKACCGSHKMAIQEKFKDALEKKP